MGYKRPETVYKLVFEEHDGLEVRAASVPVGRLLDVADLADRLREGKAKSFDEARELFQMFAKALRSWNLEEEDGTPVPATIEGVMSLEFEFATAILMAWFDAIGSVPAPLEPRSTGGLPSVVPSLPMESLSASLPS